ncbi:hypothetical protein BJV78DRAFT_1279363 [Lactifluus subvellereus]|nr:hypothetical protein BJV78DRAFT_1279363 [Lactifluus subvellereus]
MSLRAIRRSTGSNAVDWMVTSAQIASDVSSMLQFPPTMAVATVLLAILQIIADIKTNQQDCLRLAQRAARLLMVLGRRMEGKWDDAPQSLLENIREFEVTLLSIRDFMLKATQTTWINRFMAKTSIQDALLQYDQQLRDAAMSFQVASLIEIHYAMRGVSSNNPSRTTDGENITNPIESLEALSSSLGKSTLECSVSSFELAKQSRDYAESTVSSFSFVEADPGCLEPAIPVPAEEEEFLANITGDVDEFGFRRYHQSDVILRKGNRKAVGWFAGTSEAQAGGQKMTIKRYDGQKDLALKQWVKDIKTLRNLHHENLPQILGYSDGKAQTPFILLASVQCSDLASAMRTALTTQGLADCASLILKTYRDIASAITHAQQQLSLSENEAQDFIDHATYSIDSDNNVIVGLPPPREGWLTARSYGLEESLAERALQNFAEYLKELMNAEETALQAGSSKTSASLNKYKQLKGLLHSLLPRRREGPELSPELEDLLDDVDEDNPLTLRSLRALSIEQSRHDQTWPARAPVGALATGDYGYIPGGSTNFADFVRLGNLLDGEDGRGMEVVGETHGTMDVRSSGFHGFPQRQPASPFLIPGELECWPVALPPRGSATLFVHHKTGLTSVNNAWQLLIAHGASLASTHGVKPQDLILVIRSLRIDDHRVEDWRPSLLPVPGLGRPTAGFGPNAASALAFPQRGGFGGVPASPQHGFGAQAPAVPSIVYLVTSARPEFTAYITDDHMGRPRPRPTSSTSWCFSCRSGYPVGYVDYIQLDAEDVQ